jgi:hypothetical protein
VTIGYNPRFNTYREAPPRVDRGGWAWSPHGVWDSHVPECFPFIEFSTERVDEAAPTAGCDREPARTKDAARL